MIHLKELTVAEKRKSYAKYYYKGESVLSAEKLSLIEQPISADQALPIDKLNDLLDPGYMEVETGWCCLPNGAAYVANHTKMPGVTVDMVNWWFGWHSLDNLRYKIWWPRGHYSISIAEKDRKTILNPNTLPTQRFQGMTHHVVEDAGSGKEDILISFLTPKDAGFDMDRFTAPHVGTLIAANGLSSPVHAPSDTPKAPGFMLHFVREIPGGVEFRSRFWMGYQMIDGVPTLRLPPDIEIPTTVPQGLLKHNICEYTNLAAFLPQLYREQQGLIK